MNMPRNNGTTLLTTEENELAFSLLGPRCRALATTVVELFMTRGKDSANWYKKDVGVLCFVKDGSRMSYFFDILCLIEKRIIWEHEIYNNMNYMAPTRVFHTFEAEDCIAAFNFADENEGVFMRKTVLKKLEFEKRRTNNIEIPISNDKSDHGMLHTIQGPEIKLKTANNKTAKKEKKKKYGGKGKKGEKQQLTSMDIGMPGNFKHIGHVGWDTNGTSMGLQLQTFLQRAGVSDRHLKDKDTWNFILEFITENGGMEAVAGALEDVSPIPSPGTTRVTRGPPAYPPPPLPSNILSPMSLSESPRNPPVPQRPGAPVPPPPPPPPAPGATDLPPPLPALDKHELSFPDNPRDLLLDAIRNRPKLKPTENDLDSKPKEPANSRDNLLLQIRDGVILKRVTEEQRTKSTPASNNRGGLAAVLKDALSKRFNDMNPDLNEPEESIENYSPTDDWESSETN